MPSPRLNPSARDAIQFGTRPASAPAAPENIPPNYVIDAANDQTTFTVSGHRVTITLQPPPPEANRFPNGDEVAAIGHYKVEPINSSTTNPCNWSGPVWRFAQNGYLSLLPGLPHNFPLPVTSRTHLKVRGVNENE